MATPPGATPSNAATRVFSITELLEAILEHVRAADAAKTFFNGHHFQLSPCKALIKLTGVHHTFKACIEQPTLFQKHPWIVEDHKIVPSPTYASIPAVLIDRKHQMTVTHTANIAPRLWFVVAS
ncbi:hypothetical protein AC578_8301 [Pseudocercospora eumusae]|uniref:Uncharacterized protein n=1 Tax=Pseudocercospora eumusae TaxID=321146 RepID=A0A139GZ08_9PEZI|nr:hypothetical protein AC578_8301 [Pseudocercospora eumusae]